MAKILALFGATGHQGSSVVDYVLNDPELSQQYKIRAITRDVNSEQAKHLKEKKVEVVSGDVSKRDTLEPALTGVHTIFAMTAPHFGPNAVDVESNNAKTIADVAVEKGAQYLIFSTLPSVNDISGGKYTKVSPFDAKAKAEKYIRSLPIKSAFYAPGSFMENFASVFAPRKSPDGTYWILGLKTHPQTRLPLIDASGDTGKFVGAILADPDKYEGKTFCAAEGMYSLEEIATIMSKASGQKVVFKQVSAEEFKEIIPFGTEMFAEGLGFYEEYGYFGPGTSELVEWAAKNARGKLTSYEEYLKAHPLQLA